MPDSEDPAAIPAQQAAPNVNTNGYKRPPQDILEILDAQPTPLISLCPDRSHLLLIDRPGYPPIEDLAAPMLRLAGLRINPETNGPHMAPRCTGLTLQSIATGAQRRIQLPDGANIAPQGWSPDSQSLALTVTGHHGIELWIASVGDASARRVEHLSINAAFGVPLQWLPDSSGLLVQTVVRNRGSAPQRPKVPAGPAIEESTGKSGPVRTYQDLLQDSHDEDLFDYYCCSQLVIVDRETGRAEAFSSPALFASVDVSPDGQHVLIVRIQRPFSYLLPASRFPKTVEVLSIGGESEFVVASLPLEDRIPIEGVPTGPRSVGWQPTKPATLVWFEALDEGDPSKTVPHRDRVLSLAAPYSGNPLEIARTEQRCTGLTWGERDGLAFLRDYDRDRRWTRTFQISFDQPAGLPSLVWERSINDRYADPGTPLMRPLPNGRRVMWQHGNSLFLEGSGATPRGDRPFLDRFHLVTRETMRLFSCREDRYESVLTLLTDDGTQFLVQSESPLEPPNYFHYVTGAEPKALTNFPDPAPQLRQIRRELVTFERSDGVPLSFTLYLPPGYQQGTRLPTIVWAYPREFNDPATAGQVSGSTNRFTMMRGLSHLFLLTQGYAILDETTMPVVGEPAVANDTFIPQIVASAKAAIDKAVEMGVTDPERVGVGGHSYGAFMTAHLLAHSDFFKAGVARSGAYNRTLTPFGFQNERRTFWEAPDIYIRLSPFSAADRIKTPILLIHGDADNNAGTFPIQSERLYHAIRGNGGIVRYVVLPHESHGYLARESIEHTLWEMVTWFDKHLKVGDDIQPE